MVPVLVLGSNEFPFYSLIYAAGKRHELSVPWRNAPQLPACYLPITSSALDVCLMSALMPGPLLTPPPNVPSR